MTRATGKRMMKKWSLQY